MSMHKIPLTQLEEDGLRNHGLAIGSPSQLSDVFRQGIKWALAQTAPQPVAYLRASDLERLAPPYVAGCAASLSKEPGDGWIAIYATLSAQGESNEQGTG